MDVLEYNFVHQHVFPRPRNPEPLIRKIVYDSSDRPEYVGYAVRGSATSAAVWIIEKIFYDGAGKYDHSLMSTTSQIMDNYATTVTYS